MSAPLPTRINALFIDGPIYHWDRITESQATALGVSALPARHARAIARSGPWTVRRLADGSLNVSCVCPRPRKIDTSYRGFMARVLGAADRFKSSQNGAQASSDFAPL